MDNIIAIILARGGSKSIPRKSIINFCGKPLIAWTILRTLESKYINHVFVTTEDEEIAKIANDYGATIINRPAELATDTATAESALLHAINEIEKNMKIDFVVYPQITSPLREKQDIDDAIQQFINDEVDSLFSASTLKDICAWEKTKTELKSVTFDYKNRGRRQEWKEYYLENGSIYIFKPQIIKENNNRFGGKIAIYQVPPWKSYEIDEPEDIEICEYFMQKKVLYG